MLNPIFRTEIKEHDLLRIHSKTKCFLTSETLKIEMKFTVCGCSLLNRLVD